VLKADFCHQPVRKLYCMSLSPGEWIALPCVAVYQRRLCCRWQHLVGGCMLSRRHVHWGLHQPGCHSVVVMTGQPAAAAAAAFLCNRE